MDRRRVCLCRSSQFNPRRKTQKVVVFISTVGIFSYFPIQLPVDHPWPPLSFPMLSCWGLSLLCLGFLTGFTLLKGQFHSENLHCLFILGLPLSLSLSLLNLKFSGSYHNAVTQTGCGIYNLKRCFTRNFCGRLLRLAKTSHMGLGP